MNGPRLRLAMAGRLRPRGGGDEPGSPIRPRMTPQEENRPQATRVLMNARAGKTTPGYRIERPRDRDPDTRVLAAQAFEETRDRTAVPAAPRFERHEPERAGRRGAGARPSFASRREDRAPRRGYWTDAPRQPVALPRKPEQHLSNDDERRTGEARGRVALAQGDDSERRRVAGLLEPAVVAATLRVMLAEKGQSAARATRSASHPQADQSCVILTEDHVLSLVRR